MGYRNSILIGGDSVVALCDEMSQIYGLKFDTSFLDNFCNKQYWFLEFIKNHQLSQKLLKIVEPFPNEHPFSLDA
jgi:hypothetical protein